MKKIFSLMLLLIWVISLVPVAASSYIDVTIPSFPVLFDGYDICHEYSAYPPIMYKNITYLPMTYGYARFMGLKTSFDSNSRVFDVGKTYENITEPFLITGNQFLNEHSTSLKAVIPTYKIRINGSKVVQNNSRAEYPILNFRDITYFPLTWEYMVDDFGWTYTFSQSKGLDIKLNNYTFRDPGTDLSPTYVFFNGERILEDSIVIKYQGDFLIPAYDIYKTFVETDSECGYAEERTFFYMHGGDYGIKFADGSKKAVEYWSDGTQMAHSLNVPAVKFHGTYFLPLLEYCKINDYGLMHSKNAVYISY